MLDARQMIHVACQTLRPFPLALIGSMAEDDVRQLMVDDGIERGGNVVSQHEYERIRSHRTNSRGGIRNNTGGRRQTGHDRTQLLHAAMTGKLGIDDDGMRLVAAFIPYMIPDRAGRAEDMRLKSWPLASREAAQ